MSRKRRSAEDLDLYEGAYKAFEWYWDAHDSMPGLDAYELLDPVARAGVLATFEHWGCLVPGERPAGIAGE